MNENLDRMFNPKSVAVIGATNKPGAVGTSLMKNLIGQNSDRIIYPINPQRKSVFGIKAYPSILDTNDKVDLAVIATPAKSIPAIMEECGKAGVAGVVIISAGFKEVGPDGILLAEQTLEISKKYNMRIIGPNCLGFLRPSIGLNASFSTKMALPGKIAFISQSGALCTAILDWAVKENVGFSYFMSIGSMIDIGFHDLIDYFGNDPDTSSILIYMESLTNARKFMSAARAFARTKPIIVIKVGKSSEGAKAALSHTGSLAGNDAVFDAAFKRAGIIRVNTIGELFDCAQTLAMQKRPQGNRLAIITNAGGPGVIATDYLIGNGGTLAQLSSDSMKKLNEALPAQWSHGNPVDVLGDAPPERYSKAAEICLADQNVDGAIVILTPQEMTDSEAIAKEIAQVPNPLNKTLLTSWMGADDVKKGREILKKNSIPSYGIPENAVRCFLNMVSYSKNLELLYETPATIPHAFTPNTEANKKILNDIISSGRFVLTESESKQFLSNYGIPVAKNGIAKNEEDASEIASKIGFPVVMKILSPDILHKTDVGGVKVGISSKEEAKSAFKEIISSAKKKAPKADVYGVFIEKMMKKKYELLIGSKKDPLLGPAIVFGSGGVAVEIYKDTNIALPPLNMSLAKRLIEDTKIYKLISGFRGMKSVNIAEIQFILYKFAYLIQDYPEVKEIDINPFAVDEEGGIALDAKIILDETVAGKNPKPYSHLVISPYPKEYIAKVKLKDGKTLTLRPIKPEDEPMLQQLFETFSEKTQRLRFFDAVKKISHELLVSFTQIDYDREISIIAEADKKIAGLVRLVADPSGQTAEFAIVVGDPWQGQGLGTKITDYILELAKNRGIKKIYAKVSKDNEIMIKMFEKRGFTLTKQGSDFKAEINL